MLFNLLAAPPRQLEDKIMHSSRHLAALITLFGTSTHSPVALTQHTVTAQESLSRSQIYKRPTHCVLTLYLKVWYSYKC